MFHHQEPHQSTIHIRRVEASMRLLYEVSFASLVCAQRRCCFNPFNLSLARALKFLRKRNLIHRDLKPQVSTACIRLI